MTEHGAGSSSLPEDVAPWPAEGAAIVQPSASYSIVMRVRLPQRPGSFAQVATVVGETGAMLGAIDLVRVEKGMKVRDITLSCIDAAHGARVAAAVGGIEGVTVQHVLDRTFELHLGGKIEVKSTVPLKTRDDLSMAYTPGVARVCSAIRDDVERAWALTIKGNTVRGSTPSAPRSLSAPTPGASTASPTSCSRARMSTSDCPGPVPSRWPPSAPWAPERSSSRWPIPRPRCSPRTSATTCGSWPPGARTIRIRSTTCSPSLVSSEVRWTSARARSTRP